LNHANPYSSISLFKTLVKTLHRHLRIEGFIGHKDCARRALGWHEWPSEWAGSMKSPPNSP